MGWRAGAAGGEVRTGLRRDHARRPDAAGTGYLIEERTEWFERIEEVLEQEADFPRQQFYLVPWSWRWFAQLRRVLPPVSQDGPGLATRAHRMFRLVGVDMMLNGAIRCLTGSLRWRIRLVSVAYFPSSRDRACM